MSLKRRWYSLMIWIMPLVVETALLKRSLKMMRVILAMTQRTRVMTSGWRKSYQDTHSLADDEGGYGEEDGYEDEDYIEEESNDKEEADDCRRRDNAMK